MRKKKHSIIALIIAISIMITGCSQGANTTSEAMAGVDQTTEATPLSTEASSIVPDTEFTSGDLEVGYEDTEATQINFNGNTIEISGEGASTQGNIVSITKEGSYVLSGTLENGQIIVEAGASDKVRLILAGVSITSKTSAPIYIKNADKVFLTLKDSTQNSLSDNGTEYVQTDDNTVDSVIYSMADLTLNGTGELTIQANYKHGIVSKDELVITGGTYNITAVKDTLNGKDCVKIKDGEFTLSSTTGNGIQSKNSEDTTKGYVYICGGKILIQNSREGIEGTVILITGGTIDILSQDDGLNSASASSNKADSTNTQGNGRMEESPFEVDPNCYISITGGSLKVNAQGDGIDSNGSVYISGGSIFVNGPTESMNGSMDYNGIGQITGGSIVAVGSNGMAQGFSATSTQYSLLYNLTTASEANSEITLKDSEGNVMISFTPDKQYQSVLISSPELKEEATYTLNCGSQTEEVTLTSIATSYGEQQMNPGGQRGPNNMPGEMREDVRIGGRPAGQ